MDGEVKGPGELMHELMNMPESKLRQQLLTFHNSIYVFEENYAELKTLIQFLTEEERARPILAVQNRDKLRILQLDLVRRLHNFVAAAQSLIDHTRVLRKKLFEGNDRFPDYQSRIDQEFARDPLTQFIRSLRQYYQHYRTSEVSLSIRVEQDEEGWTETRRLLIPLDDLTVFDGWSSDAKRFMNDLRDKGEDALDIGQVTKQYRDKVMNFYQWFLKRQEEIFAPELARFEAKQREFALYWLDGSLNIALHNQDNAQLCCEEHTFIDFLSQEALEEIRTISDGPRRAERVIDLIEERYPLPDIMKAKIETLYENPRFYSQK